MSQTHAHPSASSSSNFQSVLDAALEAYEKKTKTKLFDHPLAAQLQSCDSPNAVLSVLQDLIQQFDSRRSSDERFSSWLSPTVNVLYALSSTLGQGVGIISQPATVVFSGIGVLLVAAKDVEASQDVLVDIFVRIEGFFKRLVLYTEVPPTSAMTDVIVKIITELLSIFAIVTKEIKQGPSRKLMYKLLGKNDVEDALKRLDTLTTEEARMATAETLKVTNRVDVKVDRVDNKVDKMDDRFDKVDDKMEKVDDKVDKVDGKVDMVDNKVTVLIDDVKEANERSAVIAGEDKQSLLREKSKQWLSPPDPSKNHNIARKAHHKGTASWFFQSRIYEEWKSSPSFLWIHGKPGSGKSVLSGIIEDIMAQREAESAIVAYFYCDFRDEDKQTCRNLVLSIISQLCAQSNLCCGVLSRIYLAHDEGARAPSDETLTRCLTEMVSLPVSGPIYLIFDALDECPNNTGLPTPREEVLDLVNDLIGLGLPKLHMCVTSRPEIDIQTILEPLTSLCVSLHNQTGQKQDIVDYISSIVYSDKKMGRWREDDRKLVVEMLSERADGMFRWVYCQLEALRHCLPPSVRGILEALPDTLDDTYERVLREINKANRDHARRLLQCLTVALRPLRVEELAEVLAIDFDAPAHGGIPQLNPNWRWADHHRAVLSTCSSLIAIVDDGGSKVVQFSHFSVKEYLTSDRLARSSGDVSRYHILLEPAHTILAQACLGVLLRLDDSIDKDDAGDIPLVEYAAQHWFDHAGFENVASRIRDAMEYFFDADKPHWAAWSHVQMVDVSWDEFTPFGGVDGAFPLYYVSLGGFYDLVEHLIGKHPEHINAMGGCMATPLVAALHLKHFQVAELLHLYGADVDVRGALEFTPLLAACRDKYLDIVEWLLNHGADANAQGSRHFPPLLYAADHGCLQMLRMLIDHNANIHNRNDLGESPLHLAASPSEKHDQVDIMQVLLDHGADPNAPDSSGATPLHSSSWCKQYSSYAGTVEGTHLLIKYGAIIDAEDNEGRTPLQLALEHGRYDIATCLVEHGAGLDITTNAASSGSSLGS